MPLYAWSSPTIPWRRRRSPIAPNQLKGEVIRVKSGTIMAEVEVKIEAGTVVAAITDGSLKCYRGDDRDVEVLPAWRRQRSESGPVEGLVCVACSVRLPGSVYDRA